MKNYKNKQSKVWKQIALNKKLKEQTPSCFLFSFLKTLPRLVDRGGDPFFGFS